MTHLYPKEYKPYIKAALDQGWTVAKRGPRSHGSMALMPPEGGIPLVIYGTPGTHRALDDFRTRLRRRGVVLPRPGR